MDYLACLLFYNTEQILTVMTCIYSKFKQINTLFYYVSQESTIFKSYFFKIGSLALLGH